MKPTKPTKPSQPTGMSRSSGAGRRGRAVGTSMQYTPEQTARYRSQGVRYAKAVELANAGPDFVQFNGQILSSDDAANLRNAGGEAFKPTDRVNFRYASERAPLEYWTVTYSPGDVPADGGGTGGTGGGGGGVGQPGPPGGTTIPPGEHLLIYGMTDNANGAYFPGLAGFTLDRWVTRLTNTSYNIFDVGNWLGIPGSRYPYPLLRSPPTGEYSIPFPPGAPDNQSGLGIEPRYTTPDGWTVILVDCFGFQRDGYWTPPLFYNAGFFLAYGHTGLPLLDVSTGYYNIEPNGNPWQLTPVYDGTPSTPPPGPSKPPYPPDPGLSGSSVPARPPTKDGFLCNCPDFVRWESPIVKSAFDSEQTARDWTNSGAGCDVVEGCKHVMGTRLFLALPQEAPKDYPL